MQRPPHAFHGLLHSARLLELVLQERLEPLNILPRQAHVLTAIARMGPVSQAELAAAFEVTQASMSTMIERLLAAGLVTRRQDPAARRRNLVDLTDAGRDKLDAIHGVWATMDDHVRDLLGEEDAEQLFLLANRLRVALGGHPPGKAPEAKPPQATEPSGTRD